MKPPLPVTTKAGLFQNLDNQAANGICQNRSKKHHVLVVPSWFPTPEEPLEGIFCMDHAKALQQQGHRVAVLFPKLRNLRALRSGRQVLETHFQMKKYLLDGIPLYVFNAWAPPKTLRFHCSIYTKAFQWMYQDYVRHFGSPDILHAHGALWAGHAAASIGKKNKIPWITTEHFGGFLRKVVGQKNRSLAEKIWRDSPKVTAVGSDLAGHIKTVSGRDDIAIIPNPVDTELFSPAVDRNRNGNYAGVNFFALGRLVPGKGFRSLLAGFALAFKGRKGFKLKVGGAGPLRADLEKIASRLGISEQVTLSGPLSRLEVAQALTEADFFVHASPSESFGVVMLEALAAGVPVIAVRSGGPDDFVTENCGYLVDPGDVKALASGMDKASDKIDEWREKRDNIRRYVVAGFSYSAVGGMFSRMYGELASEKICKGFS